MAESDLIDKVTHKVGPLPAWAWAAIPAVGYIGWSYYRAAQQDVADSGAPTDTNAPDYGLNNASSLPSYGAAPNGTSNLPFIDPPELTNLVWSKQAVNYLLSEGVASVDAITAINAYIYGVPTTITQTQMNALQKAILRFGPAPEGSTFIPKVGANTPTPTPSPSKVPEVPTAVSAFPIGSGQIRVNWGPPALIGGSKIIGYEATVWKNQQTPSSPTAGPTPNPLAGKWVLAAPTQSLLPTTRTTVFRGLKKSTIHQVKVRARNSKGYGPYGVANVVVK